MVIDESVFNIINSVPKAILKVDKDRNVLWANDTAYAIGQRLGSAGNEGTDKCHAFLFGSGKKCANCALNLTVISKKSETTKAYATREGGEPLFIESYSAPVDGAAAENEGYVVMCSDRTDEEIQKKKQLEYISALEMAKEMARKTDSTSYNILSRISKDLRSQMNGIMGMAQILKIADINDEDMEDVMLLNESCVSMNRVIDTIEEASNVYKYRNSKFKPNDPAPFKIKSIFSEVKAMYEIKAARKGLDVEFSLDREVPEMLVGDYYNMHQIMSFSLESSIINTKSGSIVMAVLLNDRDGDHVEICIRVSDTGDQGRGSGSYYDIGVIRELADIMNGRFEIEEKTGSGVVTSVYVKFEYKKQEARASEPAGAFSADKVHMGNPKNADADAGDDDDRMPIVLVADDDVNTRLSIKGILKNEFDVRFAKNGGDALALYEDLKPEILIVDILLPQMDGFELLDHIDKMWGRKGAIIACTEKVVDTEPDYLMKYGFNDYLEKPVKAEILKMVIDKNFVK